MSNPTPDDGTNPQHYRRLDPEPIEVIEKWGLGFHLGNAVKYIARAGHKISTTAALDLAKAAWYLNRARGQQPETDAPELEEIARRAAMQWRVTAERLAVRLRDAIDAKAIAKTAWNTALHSHYECTFDRWWDSRVEGADRAKARQDIERVLAGCPLVEDVAEKHQPLEPSAF